MEFFPAFLRYVLYAISFFCAIEIFTVQSSYQRKRAYLFAVMAALVLGISGLFSYLRIKGVTLFDTNYLSMMLLSLVVWLSCFFIYKEPISKRFFNILTATAGRNIGAKIASVIFYFWEIENPYLASFFQFFVVMVCLAPLYWFIGRKIKKDSSYVPPGRDLLLGFIVMIFLFPMAYLEPYLEKEGWLPYLYLLFAEVVFSLFVVMFSYHLYVNEVTKMKDRFALQLTEQRLSQASDFKNLIDIMNIKIHDLKHQKNGTVSPQLKEEVGEFASYIECGNPSLDAILTSKSLLATAKGISFQAMVDGKLFSFLSEEDLSSLFGNLIDNAIEYLETVNDPSQRSMALRSVSQNGFLKLTCENYFVGKLTLENGFPLTSKADKDYHGFGTRSIVAIASKYGGNARFSTQENTFLAEVIFPEKI